MKPIFSYYGGKQRMASKIIKLIPKHTVYVEPFAGGATVLFAKPWPKVTISDHYREVINDIDQRVINFYRVLQRHDLRDELVERLQFTPYSEADYKKSKDLNSGNEVDRAWAFFVNVSQSYSNKLNGGWRRSVFGRNEAVTWTRRIQRLHHYLDRMNDVHIECKDALEVIKTYDSPQTFFYCDPPYPGAHQGHYSGYMLEDYRSLINALSKCMGSFLLSNYEQELEVPTDWEKFEFASYSSASGKGRIGADRSRKSSKQELGNTGRVEIVYKRLNSVPVREEIQKLYDSGKFECFIG